MITVPPRATLVKPQKIDPTTIRIAIDRALASVRKPATR
jgi:hypothetical protein